MSHSKGLKQTFEKSWKKCNELKIVLCRICKFGVSLTDEMLGFFFLHEKQLRLPPRNSCVSAAFFRRLPVFPSPRLAHPHPLSLHVTQWIVKRPQRRHWKCFKHRVTLLCSGTAATQHTWETGSQVLGFYGSLGIQNDHWRARRQKTGCHCLSPGKAALSLTPGPEASALFSSLNMQGMRFHCTWQSTTFRHDSHGGSGGAPQSKKRHLWGLGVYSSIMQPQKPLTYNSLWTKDESEDCAKRNVALVVSRLRGGCKWERANCQIKSIVLIQAEGN